MKELEKTKRISIAAVLSILIVLIALLNYQRPKYLYTQNTSKTLTKLLQTDYLVTTDDMNGNGTELIDVRNPFDFEKGHIEGAVNVYAPELLSDKHADFLERIKKENKTVLIYGQDPDQALSVFMSLCQLGIGEPRILSTRNFFEKDQLITESVAVEKEAPNVSLFIETSVKNASKIQNASQAKKTVKKTPQPKQVSPVKKKKKKVPEGGC